MSSVRRLGRLLGGEEMVTGSGLPVAEFAHPWPILCMVVLGINDHVLKGSGWLPGWLTGKLSDFAGLFFFPLFVTAAVDTLLYLLFKLSRGRTPDYSLTMGRVYAAIAFTALLFVPLQLSETWGKLYIDAMRALDIFDLFGNFQVTADPTDLVALAVFPLVVLHARACVRQVPIGRLQVIRARTARLEPGLRAASIESALADIHPPPRAEKAWRRFRASFGTWIEKRDDPAPVEADLAAYRRALE